MSSTSDLLTAMIARPTGARTEDEILTLLRATTPAELDAVLTTVDVTKLVANVDDHLFRGRNREELIDLFVERAAQLGVEATSAVLKALGHGLTGARDEDAIRDILGTRHGLDLTRLKDRINVGSDDLAWLVFRAVDEGERRDAILRHIADEAQSVSAAKIISDIDDTVISNLHDEVYPRGTVYPGILAFFDALAAGTDADDMVGDLTFVTARPSDAFGLIAGQTRDTLQRAGIAEAALMNGTFLSLFSHDAIAAQKMVNIRNLRALFPEYSSVFLGDSGQGDVLVAEALRDEGIKTPAFIHDVVGTRDDVRESYALQGIYFHDSYIGAAAKAKELGLISQVGLDAVVSETTSAFDAIPFKTSEQRDTAWGCITRDLDALGASRTDEGRPEASR